MVRIMLGVFHGKKTGGMFHGNECVCVCVCVGGGVKIMREVAVERGGVFHDGERGSIS